MTPEWITTELAERLRRKDVAFRPADLEAFAAEAARRGAAPDVDAWAERFAAAQRRHVRKSAFWSACTSLVVQGFGLPTAFWWGRNLLFDPGYRVVSLASLGAIALLAIGARPSARRAAAPAGGAFARAALAVYALLFSVSCAPGLTQTRWGCMAFVGLLVPFVGAGVVFVRERRWSSAAGAHLFLFASVVAAAYNAAHPSSSIFNFCGVME